MAEPTSVAPVIVTPKSAEEVPGGLGLLDKGQSEEEGMAGLLDALGSDDDELFEELEADEQSTSDDVEDDDEGESDEGDEDPEDPDSEEQEGDEDPDQDESDDESDEEVPDETLYDVPGSDKKVTLEEALNGYSRTEDYTRKRQRDADEHRATMVEARGFREKYAEGLTRLEETLTKLGPQAPDAALRKSNPGEYAAQLAEYSDYQETLNQVGAAKEVIGSEVTDEQLAAQKAYVDSEWERVVAKVPEWSKGEVAVKALADLRSFAIEDYGFADEEINSLVDHRLLLLLKENFDMKQKRTKGQARVETKKKAAKKRLRPGTTQRTVRGAGKQKRRAQKQADQLAASSGSVRDAARAIELLLDD